MAADGSVVWKDMLVYLLTRDTGTIARRTMWGFPSNVATPRRLATTIGLNNALCTVRANILLQMQENQGLP